VPATQPATRDDIRELEARFDARFQAVSSRFARVDNRFATIDTRLDEMDRRHHTLAQRIDTRFQLVEARLDTTSAQLDDLRVTVGGIERQTNHLGNKFDRFGRVMVAGFLMSAVLTTSLWVSTMTVVS